MTLLIRESQIPFPPFTEMSPTVFDPRKHLSEPDARRLRRAAGHAGLHPGDFIETLIKRALFCDAPPERAPKRQRKEGL